MTTQKQKQHEHDDAAVQSLAAYKELKRRLEAQAAATMSAVNTAEAYDRIGQEAPPDVIDAAIGAVWKLEEIEQAIQPFLDAGFPPVRYDRPDLQKTITPLSDDPWKEWKESANIVRDNNDQGRRLL